MTVVGIRAKTDPLTYSVSNKPDVNLKAVNDDLAAAIAFARSAGTLTYEEALALGAAHRCRVKPLPKPCSGCGRPRVECVCLLSLPGMP